MFDYQLFLCYNSSNTMRLERETPGNSTSAVPERRIFSAFNNVYHPETVNINLTESLEKKENAFSLLAKIADKEKPTVKLGRQAKKANRSNKFEPFEIPESDQEDRLFVNLYGGHHAKDMELNIKTAEKTLKLAHLEGQIFLMSLPPSRNRSLDANADGSVSAKKSVFWGEKLDEEKDNPYYKVTSIPQGWKIEINDQKMMEQLMKEKINPKQKQRIFINKFNSFAKSSLESCIKKEKLSSVKDRYFKHKLFSSLVIPVLQTGFRLYLHNFSLIEYSRWRDVLSAMVGTFVTYTFINLLSGISNRRTRHLHEQSKESGQKLNLNKSTIDRKLDHPWEWIMPEVEIDKVIGSFLRLNVFSQKLVREKH
jgi:hypothetical protein